MVGITVHTDSQTGSGGGTVVVAAIVADDDANDAQVFLCSRLSSLLQKYQGSNAVTTCYVNDDDDCFR